MQARFYPSEQKEAKALIIFFNGWAMTPEVVTHLRPAQGHDLLILWDYRELSLDFDISAYADIKLMAWSMGVWAADQIFNKLTSTYPISEAVAICGTAYPMSDLRGIPQEIFEGTLHGLDEKNRQRFNRRMCGGKRLKHLFEAFSARSTEEIKEELLQVYHLEQGQQEPQGKKDTAPWTKAIIGMKDRIIPPENQKHYWQEQGIQQVIREEDDHYIFDKFSSWEEIWQL